VQFNIYVPKEKGNLLAALDRAAQRTGRPKNELVLEALEKYLPSVNPRDLGKFSLGVIQVPKRADIYEGRLGR